MISKPTIFPNIYREKLETLQVNLGYKCNQACKHCHVDASPTRTEMMSDKLINKIPLVLERFNFKSLDLTGGAPELHKGFRELVKNAYKLNVEIIDRCNLTILTESGQEDLSDFLALNKVRVVASLPCYQKENVDKQRGFGVYDRSIKGLKLLNTKGYGINNTGLILDLVYNPQGINLPPDQSSLQEAYKYELYKDHGIQFNNLLTITNMPIKRFANQLKTNQQFEVYQNLLIDSYNPNNIQHLMCKTMLSVDWKGNLYDCDFNQQLGLKLNYQAKNIDDLLKTEDKLINSPINVASHCFGCTAGSGSSCGGALQG
ncbi:arsenosugar biosynthesis radical SAM (seleno)protein ArsS [Prochlorococcus sp. MIT 1341]|uniref:arsenosugar biosynthesis radical SAM (seleno)protein ArsS n=1 Tax=Prochlorococcus sp. MIT 1341 TaxID=3096221 RepID=UPI002A75F279|nr:arsenosugar biosynthesis radical SAM (seleno)protein ArsS [Prochlorococcus sp. MIT 1341]